MAKQKGDNIYKEVDKMSSLGTSAVYYKQKNTVLLEKAMKEPDMKENLMAFLFSGDPDAESPLNEYLGKTR